MVNSLKLNTDLSDLRSSVSAKTNKVIVYEGKDAYTPIKNVDYFDGKNAVSFVETKTVIKEKPVNGITPPCYFEVNQCRGNDGMPAPKTLMRVNEETGNLEYKSATDNLWVVLLPCEKIQLSCREA